MKILFVLEYFYPHVGGVETSFFNLIKELSKDNELLVITTKIPNTSKHEFFDGINILRVSVPPFARRFWFTLFSLKALFGNAGKYDYIHTTAYNAAFPAWLVAKILRKKIVITVPEVFGADWFRLGERNIFLSALYYIYEQILFRLNFDLYIAISISTKNNLLDNFKISPKKIKVIYCLLDLDFWNPNKYHKKNVRKILGFRNEFLYLYYGRPGISKGVEYLVRAVPIIRKSIPKSRLILILSKDPYDKYLIIKKIIKQLNIENNVLLLESKNIKELPYYIVAADCVVVPSLTEGFGYCAVESTIMNKIVISTRVGAIPELNPKALFIKPKSEQAIAKALSFVNMNKKMNTDGRKNLIRMLNKRRILEIYKKAIKIILLSK
ncbi:MAG: glycosyltransferase family 4 protein [bacterium]|nr:glycosyltransferase family 4 protein [bacterium]